jgi:hypothetical protein
MHNVRQHPWERVARTACTVTRALAAVVVSLVAANAAFAQTNLGELLDAGARKLSSAQFEQEVVGQAIAGATPTGTRLELLYIRDGRIAGVAFQTIRGGATGGGASYAINGLWKADDTQRICTRIRLDLPEDCQFWFRHGDLYFLSDTDWDRQARVTVRTPRQ